MKHLKLSVMVFAVSLALVGAVHAGNVSGAPADSYYQGNPINPSNPSNPENSAGINNMNTNPSNTTSNTEPGRMAEGGRNFRTNFGADSDQLGNQAGIVGSQTVSRAQSALNAQGFSLTVDGVCGRATHDAVKRFQAQKGLSQTGELNSETLSALGVSGHKSNGMGD